MTHPPFRMPAEWEPHAATWLAWPHNEEDWPGKFGPIPWAYAEIARALHKRERVRILVRDAALRAEAADVLTRSRVDLSRIDFLEIPTDRSWTRDFGPMFVRDAAGALRIHDWRFSGWAKYDNHKQDDAVAAEAGRRLGVPVETPEAGGRRIVLEGGAIDVNGAGALLTTEECLLSDVQARNPGLTREEMEAALGRWLGVRKVLWLGRGVAGDDTHGHVDDIARFTGPRTVVACVEPDKADENHAPLAENLDRLRAMTDQDGRPLEVVELPMPARVDFEDLRLPASYANFYIANGAVLVPTFNDPLDREALAILARLFPDREAVGIHARDLVWGLGTLHCLTQQEPAA